MRLRPLVIGSLTPSVLLAATGLLCCGSQDNDDEGCEVEFASPTETPWDDGYITTEACYAVWETYALVGTSYVGDLHALVAPLEHWEIGGEVALDPLSTVALLYVDVNYSTWEVGLFAMSTAGSFSITSYEDPYDWHAGVLREGQTRVDDVTPSAYFIVSTNNTPAVVTSGGLGSMDAFFNDAQSVDEDWFAGEGSLTVLVGTTSLVLGSSVPDGSAYVYCDELGALAPPAGSRDALLRIPFLRPPGSTSRR